MWAIVDPWKALTDHSHESAGEEIRMPRLREGIDIPIIPEDFIIPDNAPNPERLASSSEFATRRRRTLFLKSRRARVPSRKKKH
jgi:hypothetical protein